MPRNYSPYASSYSFGPGPISTALKMLIGANVAMFLVTTFVPSVVPYLGLVPSLVLRQFWLWQVVTYMFLHGGIFHILFNMLHLWMFGRVGTDLGTQYSEILFRHRRRRGRADGALSLLPFTFARQIQHSIIIGIGAIYGLLLMRCKSRSSILLMSSRPGALAVLLGAIALSSLRDRRRECGCTCLDCSSVTCSSKATGLHPMSELKYRYQMEDQSRPQVRRLSGGRAAVRSPRTRRCASVIINTTLRSRSASRSLHFFTFLPPPETRAQRAAVTGGP